MCKHSIILLLAICATAGQSDRNFTVGGTPVKIGEDQEMVLARLRQTYQVHSTGPESYAIAEKNAPSFRKIGVVTFENGHLASAGATWDETFGSDGVRFARDLIAAVANQGTVGPRAVILRPIQSDDGGAVLAGFELLIGHRSIDVITTQTMDHGRATARYATVMETLHDADYVSAMERGAVAR